MEILTLATRADKTAVYNDLVTAYKGRTSELNRRYLDGEITRNTWKNAMREEVKTLHVQAYAAGRSGGWDAVTSGEWGSVGARLRRQYQFLDRFADDIVAKDLSLAQMNQRTGLYGSASRASFEAAIAAEKGVPASALPAQPGDGTTLCKANCKCRWTIKKRAGFHLVSWMLGRAEHCRTCARRARAWKNLKIQGGVMVSPVEPIFD
jgi:hypothetical protein